MPVLYKKYILLLLQLLIIADEDASAYGSLSYIALGTKTKP